MKVGRTGWVSICLIAVLFACTTPGVEKVAVKFSSGVHMADPAGIPHEYIPPPGNCRIWYPDRLPDEQPLPERCLEILQVPPGAWVVYGGAMIKTYRIEEYDPQHPGIVTYINYFELESGRFLRRAKICP